MKTTTINIEGREFTIEELKDLINKNENKLTKIFEFNKTTEEDFNKKWNGFEDHEKYLALEILIVNYYNKGVKPNWKNNNQYKYYPYFVMDSNNFRYCDFYCWDSCSFAPSRLCFLKKEDMLEAIELYLDVYKKSRL